MDYRQKFSAIASRPDAQSKLFGIAFLEAMYVPVPSDFLLIPMALLSPDRAVRYALVAAAGSVCGALVGYLLGFMALHMLGTMVVIPVWLLNILVVFKYYAAIFLISAGFSSVPFNLVTFLSGAAHVNIVMFMALSVLVRTIRYGLISWLIWRGGGRYQEWLERNFYGTMLVMTLALLVISVVGVLLFETA